MAAIVADKVFCVHGGISPQLRTVDILREMERPRDIDDEGVFSDVLWADPNSAPGADQFENNERGTSVLFSAEAVSDFLKVNQLAFIARAHQAVKGGYEWAFGDSVRSVVTVFSCPDYMQFGNKAAVMRLDTEGNPTFITLDPEARQEERPARGPIPEVKRVGYEGLRW
jgi:serine/threonine-protein phosphatase PP1 catalytic subunit